VAHQDDLTAADLVRYATDLGFAVDRFHVTSSAMCARRESPKTWNRADVSGATGTPTFFMNGQRHYGADDLDSLTAAITTARAHQLTPAERPRGTAEQLGDLLILFDQVRPLANLVNGLVVEEVDRGRSKVARRTPGCG
jgi:DSBA-like thioredoxin domain